MCGIAGELALDGGIPDTRAVERMTEALAPRGPDGHGYWSNRRAALGHRRLSIIDLSDAGRQPMRNAERGLTVVFNGCIYNHHELRRELSGYPFASTSDTEVLLAAYERWGDRLVDHLVGMFAFLLIDERRDRVLICRDRLGIKPLYLAEVRGRLRFASSLPALLAGGGVDTELDPVGLHHYLSWHSIVPAPRTILRGVTKLPAATLRVIESDGRTHDTRYWQPDYVRDAQRADWSSEDWRDAVHEKLLAAVKRRLVADVPVGVLLSGGVDSSLIVALMAEAGREEVPTFSIGFSSAGGESGDEFEYSDVVAREFGTDHHRMHIDSAELTTAIGDALEAMSEPMGSPDVTAFYLLSRAVSQHVKVVQCGQGADEVFGGYAYHQPASEVPRDAALDTFSAAFFDRTHEELGGLLRPELTPRTDVSRRLLAQRFGEPGGDTALDAVLRADTHLLMIDDPVKRVDNMSMAWGLEARVPFLDHDLVELVAAMPPELKAAEGGKVLLKDLARTMLPREVIDRPKGYFPVPAFRHLEGGVLDFVTSTLRAPEARSRGMLRREAVDAVLERPNERFTRVRGNVAWELAILEGWLQRHGIGTSASLEDIAEEGASSDLVEVA